MLDHMLHIHMSDNSSNYSIVNHHFNLIAKIAKYAPECGHLWPQYCYNNQWDTAALLHSPAVVLVKMLAILDEMYGESMTLENDSTLANMFIDFFDNKNNVLL